MYQEFDNRKGLRYAREIVKLDGKYSAARRDNLPVGVSPQHGVEALIEGL